MTEPYTAADVQLVAEALSGPRWKEVVPLARAAVAALAEAGRLVPADAEVRKELTIRYTNLADVERETAVLESPAHAERLLAALIIDERCREVTLMRRRVIVGPWVEADEDSTR